MQPLDRSRLPLGSPAARRPPQLGAGGAAPALDGDFDAAFAPRRLTLAGPALLIEARFRDLTLATRLLRADEPAAGAARFSIGAARGADAPVNPAYLGEPTSFEPAPHALLEAADGNFALNLSAVMRPELITPTQRLVLHPDVGSVEAPLVIPPESLLRIPCGEVTFEITSAEPPAAVPRPWLAGDWRGEARYTAGAGLLLLLAIAIVSAIPADPRTLSLDDLGISHRLLPATVIPPDVAEPEVDRALDWIKKSGGSSAPAAAGPIGKAGDKKAPKVDGKQAVKGPPAPREANQVAAQIRANPLLVALDGPPTSEVAKIFAAGPVLGGSAEEVLGHLTGTNVAFADGAGGLNAIGTGNGGGGTGERMLAGTGLGTIGDRGGGGGTGPGYGRGAGPLGHRQVARLPDVIPGISAVRGSLDKEIIRRIVRRHLNEVRYCYEQELPRQPKLAGRMVVQFTIAQTGRVLASVMQSSTLNALRVESCVVNAVKRWEFPEPSGGGLVMVSYPFQLSPSGG